jgi:GntR family transcriptional regulator
VAQAKYQQIADQLRSQIASGTYRPDDRLPSEPDLIRQYDASRNTVRLALALLTNQGLVETRQGLGTFVHAPPKPFTALLARGKAQPPAGSASAAMPVVGSGAGTPQTVRFLVESLPASNSVAAKLDVKPGDPVIVRRRAQQLDGVPWLLLNSYFPMDLAEGTPLAQASMITQGSMKMLAELGYEQLGFVDEIGARMPNNRELDFFQLPTGMPVIVVNRTAYTATRPIRLTRYIYRGDRARLAHVQGAVPARFRDGS